MIRNIYKRPMAKLPKAALFGIAVLGLAIITLAGCPDNNTTGGSDPDPNPTPTPSGKTLSSISVTTKPTKTKYNAGETLVTAGLKVTAYYSDSTNAEVTTFTTDPANGAALNTAGSQTVTVSYTEGEVTKTATFSVTVTAASVPGGDTTPAKPTIGGSITFSTITVTFNFYPDPDNIIVEVWNPSGSWQTYETLSGTASSTTITPYNTYIIQQTGSGSNGPLSNSQESNAVAVRVKGKNGNTTGPADGIYYCTVPLGDLIQDPLWEDD